MKVITCLLVASAIISANQVLAKGPNDSPSYYLTPGEYLGDEVLFQCAKHYHFASIWEIRDTSNLSYDLKRGLTTEESGFGPPAHIPGWLRSGALDTPACDNWTSSANGEEFPELGRLGSFGTLDPGQIFGDQNGDGWFLENQPCWIPIHVWCASD